MTYAFLKPYILTSSIILGVSLVASIIVIEPWNEVHFGKLPTRVVKIHDTIKIMVHDTVYTKGSKSFNNKINSVKTLNQN